MDCAECGCEVERGGIRVEVCGKPDCCCADLPVRRADLDLAIDPTDGPVRLAPPLREPLL